MEYSRISDSGPAEKEKESHLGEEVGNVGPQVKLPDGSKWNVRLRVRVFGGGFARFERAFWRDFAASAESDLERDFGS